MVAAAAAVAGAADAAGAAVGAGAADAAGAAVGADAVNGARAADAATIARGRYLATAAHCAACHSVDAESAFAGGVALKTPFGTLLTPNITPDPQTGIGTWSDEQFYRALHWGLGVQGEHLYPLFPYDAYTKLRREDVLAIKAYLFSLPAIHRVIPPPQLRFPFDQRWLLGFWKLLNFRVGEFQPDPSRSADWNRGAYLVEALANCGACHTPRNLTLGTQSGAQFAGAMVGSWRAYNITTDPVGGIADWSNAELTAYLSTGVAAHKANAVGPMADVVEHSLSLLPAQDIADIVSYMRLVPGIRLRTQGQSRFSWGRLHNPVIDVRGNEDLEHPTGRTLYYGNCAACHGGNGGGTPDGAYPSLVHNTVVGASEANNLVMTLLVGVHRTVQGHTVAMPAFGAVLSDAEIAALANYVLNSYGDPGIAHVDAAIVAAWRAEVQPTPALVTAFWTALGAGVLVLVGGTYGWRRRRRRGPGKPWARV
jgi:mono/diheme cytochrome c family protein